MFYSPPLRLRVEILGAWLGSSLGGFVRQLSIPSLLRVKPKAVERLGKYCRLQAWSKVALIWGEGIEPLLGPAIASSLASAGVKPVHQLAVTSTDVEWLFAQSLKLPLEVQAILAIGGGKSLDAGKYLAHLLQKPLGLVPTAISNDGFCSPSSSLSVAGQRRSMTTRMPDLLVLDTQVLQQAPVALMFSGIGDLFAKATALWDWNYAFKSQAEPFNDFAALVTRNALDTFVHCQPKDPACLEYQRVLASSLMMCGLAMAAAGSSRPASGSEHLISHAYDRLAKVPSLHGLQVGVASYAIAHLQRDSLPTVLPAAQQSGFLDFAQTQPLQREAFLAAIDLAPEIKPGFVTLLSDADARQALRQFCLTDPLMQRLLV